MTALSSELKSRCRTALRRCAQFQSYPSLQAVFSIEELAAYHDELPLSPRLAPQEQIELTIDFLRDRTYQGQSVLFLFLRALRDSVDEADDLHQELNECCQQVEFEFKIQNSESSAGTEKIDGDTTDVLPSPHSKEINPRFMKDKSPGGPYNYIRWLHLSDICVTRSAEDRKQLFSSILADVQNRVNAGQEPHMVFITGDVADKGKNEEYEAFFEEFLMPLSDILSDEVFGRIFFVPGNHDVDRDEARSVQKYGILGKLDHFLYPDNEGFRLREDLLKRFRAFTQFDATANPNTEVDGKHWILSPQGFQTYQFEVNYRTIGVLCLNTAWLSESDEDRNWLSPGEMLVEEGLKKIQGCDIRIALGHHPIDWFLPDEIEAIRAKFAKYNVLYLHGHLHENTFHPEIGIGKEFLTLVAGASFQARQQNLWTHYFLWSELDSENKCLYLELNTWSIHYQEQQLPAPSTLPERFRAQDADGQLLPYWRIPLPDLVKQQDDTPIPQTWVMLPGWEYINHQSLKRHELELTDLQVLKFFDGRLPGWQDALSPRIPRREKVAHLIPLLKEVRRKGIPQITLLLGAAGEGKSTILRQVICDLLKEDQTWHVLWNTDAGIHTQSLLPIIQNRPGANESLLIVSDEADVVADKIYDAVDFLQKNCRKNVQFLLCCQPIAWKEVKEKKKIDFSRLGKDILVEETVRGLSRRDAQSIVKYWKDCANDDEGLGKLKGLCLEEAQEELYKTAQSLEISRSPEEGSFFGAILAVRYGDDLHKHIEDVLTRLQKKTGKAEKKQFQALAYIAATHVLETVRLSTDILATLLECKHQDIPALVIKPLADEAFISHDRDSLYTRHKEIARSIILTLTDTFYTDFEQIYLELVQGARRTYLNSPNKIPSPVTDIGEWNRLSEWFYRKDDSWFGNKERNKRIGLKMLQGLTEVEKDNPVFYSQMSALLRKDQDYEASVTIMRSNFMTVRTRVDREYYYEWGTAEGQIGNHAVGAWLSGISIADEVYKDIDNRRAMTSLAGLAIALWELYRFQHHSALLEGCAGSIRLGLTLDLNNETKRSLQGSERNCSKKGMIVKDISLDRALDYMENGIVAACELAEYKLPAEILRGDELTFNTLARRCQQRSLD